MKIVGHCLCYICALQLLIKRRRHALRWKSRSPQRIWAYRDSRPNWLQQLTFSIGLSLTCCQNNIDIEYVDRTAMLITLHQQLHNSSYYLVKIYMHACTGFSFRPCPFQACMEAMLVSKHISFNVMRNSRMMGSFINALCLWFFLYCCDTLSYANRPITVILQGVTGSLFGEAIVYMQ